MSNQPNQPKQRKIKLEAPKDLTATYSNLVMISHSPQEFIFDFIQMMPPDMRARIQERVVMSPTHAKMLLKALEDNISKYEARFGNIPTPKTPPTLAEQLFQNVTGSDDNGGDDNAE